MLFKLSNRLFCVVLIVLACITGVMAIHSIERFNPDSSGFHTYAINILYHGSYSLDSTPPYEEDFIREPGYPVFLAGVYAAYDLFGHAEYLGTDYDSVDGKILNDRNDILFVKYVQLVLLIVSMLLFYQVASTVLPQKVCRVAAVVLALYYPFVNSCSYVMREPLVTLLVALMCFFASKYLQSDRKMYLIATIVILALAALTWQAMIAFTPITVILMFIKKSKISTIFLYAGIFGVIFALLLTPWILYVYDYYPDIRIIKTLGTTLTHEVMDYASALDEAVGTGALSREEVSRMEHLEFYPLSSREVFSRSFGGWYSAQADSIRAVVDGAIPETTQIEHKARKIVSRLMNMCIQNNWEPLITARQGMDPHHVVLSVILNGISIIIAVTGVIGVVFIRKKSLAPFLPYIMFIVLFYIIGSESRRFIPYIPFLVLMSISGLAAVGTKVSALRAVKSKGRRQQSSD